jgi:hypothetical protein
LQRASEVGREARARREEKRRKEAAYGFVNRISDAPRDHRVKWELKYVRAGRMPHTRGSSSLERMENELFFELSSGVGAWGFQRKSMHALPSLEEIYSPHREMVRNFVF